MEVIIRITQGSRTVYEINGYSLFACRLWWSVAVTCDLLLVNQLHLSAMYSYCKQKVFKKRLNKIIDKTSN